MLYPIILTLHIIAGFTALLSGGISFTAPKGRKLHTTTGKAYSLAMLGVGITAISMCLLKYNPFLFTIGIFSTYMTLSGYRSLQYHKGSGSSTVYVDWLISAATFLMATGFVIHIILAEGLHFQGAQRVLLIFVSILLLMLISDMLLFRKLGTYRKKDMLRRHIGRMGGAYISTVTAFLVTNIHTEPLYLGWLLPTAIGTPFIIYFIRRYAPRKKAARQAQSA